MARKRYSTEDIIGKLREVEVLQAQGYTTGECWRDGADLLSNVVPRQRLWA